MDGREEVMTGRKRVEGATAGGMFGLLKRQCLYIELNTRNCCASRQWQHVRDEAWDWHLHATQTAET